MSSKNNHLDTDDNWRLKFIPWSESEAFEQPLGRQVKGNYVGQFIFIFAFILFLVVLSLNADFSKVFELSQGTPIFLAFSCLPFVIVGYKIAQENNYKGWFWVKAKLLDFETKEPIRYRSGKQSYSVCPFRLLCEYEHEGEQYQLNPEIVRISNIASKKAVGRIIRKFSDQDGNCEIIIDPQHRLHSLFGFKRMNAFFKSCSFIYIAGLLVACLYVSDIKSKSAIQIKNYDSTGLVETYKSELALLEQICLGKGMKGAKESFMADDIEMVLITHFISDRQQEFDSLKRASPEYYDFRKHKNWDAAISNPQRTKSIIVNDKYIVYARTYEKNGKKRGYSFVFKAK